MKECNTIENDTYDVIFVTGDAFVDHPTNGAAVLRRVLEARGYRTAVIDQPDIGDKDALCAYGRPRLFFAVNAGLVDSLVANYTPLKRRRERDRLGYQEGLRPDRSLIAYVGAIKRSYKSVPVIIGGIEASLRRFSHYDYWQNKVRRSVLLDSKATVLVYGMGERQILEIAKRCEDNTHLDGIAGTVIQTRDAPPGALVLPSFETACADKEEYIRSFEVQYANQDPFTSPAIVEPYDDGRTIVQYPPSLPLTTEEMDHVYELGYTRMPERTTRGSAVSTIPVEFSIITHRGCFGACSFCALSMHQGRYIQSRSRESILREARSFLDHPRFKGIIDDVGGPTANMYGMGCGVSKGTRKASSIIDSRPIDVPVQGKGCKKACLYPACPHLVIDHTPLITLLRDLKRIDGIRHVFVRSGIRYDLALKDEKYIKEMCRSHISGQLKIAPEHVDKNVLRLMNKPPQELFETFMEKYRKVNKDLHKSQYIVPYMIVAHPGSTMASARALARFLRSHHVALEQIQVFTPTPMTKSTAMYYTGIEPFTRKKVYVPYTYKEKKLQKDVALGKSNRKKDI